jgi:hypothetical protein
MQQNGRFDALETRAESLCLPDLYISSASEIKQWLAVDTAY